MGPSNSSAEDLVGTVKGTCMGLLYYYNCSCSNTVTQIKSMSYYIQVFKKAYCDEFDPHNFEEAERVCKKFNYKPELLQKPKFLYILHFPRNMLQFGPTAAFNTERFMN